MPAFLSSFFLSSIRFLRFIIVAYMPYATRTKTVSGIVIAQYNQKLLLINGARALVEKSKTGRAKKALVGIRDFDGPRNHNI
jgi:hypothetical protein